MLKTVVLPNIFVEAGTLFFFRILWWIENSKQHLFETEVFCNIINVFTVTFDQFIGSLLKRNINLITDPKLLNNSVHCCLIHEPMHRFF